MPADEPGEPPGLSGADFRQAMKRAASDRGRERRNQRGRRGRDPYARAVPGGRIMPPRLEQETPVPAQPDEDRLGQIVRAAWVEAAAEHPYPKPSWLLPWEQLDDFQKEADRHIGAAVVAAERERVRQLLAEAMAFAEGEFPGDEGAVVLALLAGLRTRLDAGQ